MGFTVRQSKKCHLNPLELNRFNNIFLTLKMTLEGNF